MRAPHNTPSTEDISPHMRIHTHTAHTTTTSETKQPKLAENTTTPHTVPTFSQDFTKLKQDLHKESIRLIYHRIPAKIEELEQHSKVRGIISGV